MSASKGETFRKPYFIGTQNLQNVIIESKVQKAKIKKNKTKVVVSASYSLRKRRFM